MSTPNPVVTAGIPELVSVLQSLQTFITNLGGDPASVAVKFPGALQVLLGSVEMQFPALASAEFGALQTDVNTKISGWITKLQAAAK
jgi:hypothetical protein